MKNKYYTPDGQHPEDEIFKVKNFINELSKVQEEYFQKLINDLKLNNEGIDFLFDYIHNSGEDGNNMEFSEYLSNFKRRYENMVEGDILYVPANQIAEMDTDFPFYEK